MESEMTLIPLAAFPVFHSELLPDWCRGHVGTMDPVANANGILETLPISPSGAGLVLNDWQRRNPEELRREMTRMTMTAGDRFDDAEERAIAAFMGRPSSPADADPGSCQRMLLLAYAQEEGVSELIRISARYEEQKARLNRLLDDDELPAVRPEHMDSPLTLLPNWRFVLLHLAPLLKPGTVLLVTDPKCSAELLFSHSDTISRCSVPYGVIGSFMSFQSSADKLLGRKIRGGDRDMTLIVKA